MATKITETTETTRSIEVDTSGPGNLTLRFKLEGTDLNLVFEAQIEGDIRCTKLGARGAGRLRESFWYDGPEAVWDEMERQLREIERATPPGPRPPWEE